MGNSRHVTHWIHALGATFFQRGGRVGRRIPTSKTGGGAGRVPDRVLQKCEDPDSVPATLFTSMMKCGADPSGTEAIFRGPLDKAGEDPTRCENRRPRDLSSPFMKLLELERARRMPPMLEGQLAESPYAYQKGRSTEILLADQKGRLFDLRGGFGHRGGIR